MAQYSTLRSLAKAYANGKIKKDKYRKDRAAYLESVFSGTVSLPANVPESASEKFSSTYSRTLKGDEIDKAGLSNIGIDKDSASQSSPTSYKGLVIGAIAVCIIIVVAIVIISGGDADTAQTQQATTQANQSNAPPSAAQNLLTRFLEDNNWSQSELDVFLTNWRGISETQRASAMTSTEFSRFINAIYKKLLEERALSRIGNPQTSYEKQRQLVDFASTIGIRDQRISLPDEPAVNGQ
jgi:hypothetical protein